MPGKQLLEFVLLVIQAVHKFVKIITIVKYLVTLSLFIISHSKTQVEELASLP